MDGAGSDPRHLRGGEPGVGNCSRWNGCGALGDIGAGNEQVAIRGRVRSPGSAAWVKVQRFVTEAAQDIALAGDRKGDFSVSWVRYDPTTGVPQVLFSRLDSRSATLSKPQQPFTDKGYGHQSPQVAVTDGGTVFVSTTASPKVSTNPPTYRAEVGMKRPGEPWRTRFLSPADVHAVVRSLAVSPNGHAMVTFIQGYELAVSRVRAATRPAGADSTWTVDNVSAPGDAQGAKAAIGPNGMAAIEWNAPSDGNAIVRLAFRNVTTGDPWVSTDLVTGPGFHSVETPVVDPDGYITGFWWNGQISRHAVQEESSSTPMRCQRPASGLTCATWRWATAASPLCSTSRMTATSIILGCVFAGSTTGWRTKRTSSPWRRMDRPTPCNWAWTPPTTSTSSGPPVTTPSSSCEAWATRRPRPRWWVRRTSVSRC